MNKHIQRVSEVLTNGMWAISIHMMAHWCDWLCFYQCIRWDFYIF